MGSLFGGKRRALSASEKEACAIFRACSSSVKRIVEKHFGAQFSQGDPEHHLRKWIYNIGLNLDMSCTNLTEGRDRQGKPLDIDRLKSGLQRMCSDYLASEYMVKLDRFMGPKIRDEIKAILSAVREASEKL